MKKSFKVSFELILRNSTCYHTIYSMQCLTVMHVCTIIKANRNIVGFYKLATHFNHNHNHACNAHMQAESIYQTQVSPKCFLKKKKTLNRVA